MKIAMACDHGGYELKEYIKNHLMKQGHLVEDFGTDSLDSCDYPDFAAPAARSVAEGKNDRGVLICTTGIGVSMVANKVRGIRCALCGDTLSASLTRRHNDTNCLALGAGIIGKNLAIDIVDTWLTTEFEGGRHERRIAKVMAVEEN